MPTFWPLAWMCWIIWRKCGNSVVFQSERP